MNGKPLPRSAALALVLAVTTPGPLLAQGSWAFAPGAYTHSPASGVRVTQYAPHEPVEGLPDPRQTVSRYWRTRTNVRGADGSQDTIYEVRSFGNTLGGFDAQRERGFDAQLDTLDALTPFRFNPYLFFGGLQGFGYGTPGYPAPIPGLPIPTPQGAAGAPCSGPDCVPAGAPPSSGAQPPVGLPGTAYPYAPPSGFVAPPFYPPFGFGYPYGGGSPYGGGLPYGATPYGGPRGGGEPPWWGYGPGRTGHVPGA